MEKIIGSPNGDTDLGNTVANEHIKGRKGDDVINGGGGNDIVEGNQGNDTLNGGAGDDILFGGVGTDTLTGGEGADEFAMRITYGGNNTITDFNLGEDTLSFFLDRKHFVLENDLARSEGHQVRLDTKLDEKIDNLDIRVFEQDIQFTGTTGQEKANAFVDLAIAQELKIEKNGSDLVLNFFADEGSKGTSITLKGLVENVHVARILNSDDETKDASLIEMLTTGKIIGTSGHDTITGSDGDDHIEGRGGDDQFKGYGDKSLGNDTLDGGEGFETANYWYQSGHIDASVDADGNIIVEQILGSRQHSDDESIDYSDTLISVEKIVGTRGDDQYDFSQLGDLGDGLGITITDNPEQASNDFAIGSDYNDNINLLNGDDTIYGGKGNDTLRATGGSNEVYGEDGNDTLNGGNHNDYLDGGDGDDTLHGGHYHGNDTLIGGAGNDILRGGGGNDVLKGGDGEDKIYAGSGDDEIYADQKVAGYQHSVHSDDYIDGGEGIDSLYYSDNIDGGTHLEVSVENGNTFTVHSMNGEQLLATDTVKNVEVLAGTRGDDILDFSGLDHGITYNDKWTGAGKDKVTGTDHDDVIKVMHGDDTVVASGGKDYVDGGHGTDTLVVTGTHIVVEANGPAYKQEYKVYEQGSGETDFTIVKNVELINFNGEDLNLGVGEYQ